jgi:hypothetical protein
MNGARAVNEELLRVVARRLGETDRFEAVAVFPSNHPESIIPRLREAYYPEHVREARLDIRVYLNGDFHVMYIEDLLSNVAGRTDSPAKSGEFVRRSTSDSNWSGDRWCCRWDRHENPHNTRDHFHPPPKAATETARDESFPADFFDVIAVVLDWVEERLGAVWTEYE